VGREEREALGALRERKRFDTEDTEGRTQRARRREAQDPQANHPPPKKKLKRREEILWRSNVGAATLCIRQMRKGWDTLEYVCSVALDQLADRLPSFVRASGTRSLHKPDISRTARDGEELAVPQKKRHEEMRIPRGEPSRLRASACGNRWKSGDEPPHSTCGLGSQRAA
jgi:hypothetical protein